MLVPFSWLKEFLNLNASLETVTATLDRIGLEVESVENPADSLKNFRIAQIKEAEKHPDADRLRICKVDVGSDHETLQIVCGAPNARPGIKVICALPGAVVPANGMVIKKGKIRGVESAGMMCSYRELGQGDEDSGIAELPETAPVGEGYAAWAGLDDPVIDISITPDRGDALGIRGIARDLAAAGLGVFSPLSERLLTLPVLPEQSVEVQISLSGAHESAPYFTGRVIGKVKNQPSPVWLAQRLKQMGSMPRNALVDVTNYLLYALNRPLHVFDADKIAGKKLVIGAAKSGEVFEALNGENYTLADGDMVVRDGEGVIQSLLGIMGGARSAVSLETVNVFVESAFFNPAQIAKTARRLGLSSDSAYRFERGIDPASEAEGLEIASRLIVLCCGGQPGTVVCAGQKPDIARQASFCFDALQNLGHVQISLEAAQNTLCALGFKPAGEQDGAYFFEVPSWRNDIVPLNYQPFPAPALEASQAKQLEEKARKFAAQAQLVNEIVRLKGYGEVQAQPLPEEKTHQKDSGQKSERERQMRRFCAARGLQEMIGFSFIPERDQKLFGELAPQLTFAAPVASGTAHLRSSLLPNLLEALSRNLAKGLGLHGEAGFFELGPVFGKEGEQVMLAGLRGGRKARLAYEAAVERKGGEFGWREAQSDLLGLLEECGVNPESLYFSAEAPSYYHPGRSGTVYLGRKMVLGYFGEIHPEVLAAFEISNRASAFELFPQALSFPKKGKTGFVPLSLQPVRRDFAFLAPKDISGQEVIQSVKKALRGGKNFIKPAEVRIFDLFEDAEKLGAGKKSFGVEVMFYPQGESLTEAELSAWQEKIREQAAQIGAELRSA